MATLSITARTAGSAELIKTQALAVLMPERKTLSPLLKALDKRLGGTVARSLHNGDFTGATGSHIWLPGADGVERRALRFRRGLRPGPRCRLHGTGEE